MSRKPRATIWLWLAVLVAGAAIAGASAEPNSSAPPAAQQPKPSPRIGSPRNLADLVAIEARVKAVAAKVLPSVVAVRVGESQGSGVVVSQDGYVLTAGHVAVSPAQPATFIFPDGKNAKGTTLGIHRRADAGLMKITDPGPWPSLEMGTSADLEIGDWCVAVGHPLGYQEGRPPVVRVGRVLRAQGPLVQTDCPLVAGDSGGPLFDLDAKVIGINSRIAGSATMNFHVPVDVFRDVWERLVKGEAWDEEVPGKDSAQVKSLLREVVASAGGCAVRVKCDGKDVALGTIVGPDGWILTKASELAGHTVCRLRDGRELEARLIGVHPQFDLAMLKVEATDLPVIPWNSRETVVGQWVATPGAEDSAPLAMGVLSVPRRPIPPASGVLGVALGDAEDGGRILNVLPDSAAQKAGLRPDDIITHVAGLATHNQSEVIAAIKRYRPGQTVQLRIKRGDKTLEIAATLAKLDTPATRKRDLQNRSTGGISSRSDDFPMVLQHDTVVRPVDCGGPLVDLSGGVIGVNIARAGRTETYAVPTDILLTLMYDLISGRLAPPRPKPEPAPSPVKSPTFHDQYEGEPGEKPPQPRGS